MLIKDAAPLLKGREGEPLTPSNLRKRVKNSVTTQAGRSRWEALGIDPDTVDCSVDAEYTEAMQDVIGLPVETSPFHPKKAPQSELERPQRENRNTARPSVRSKRKARSNGAVERTDQVRRVPDWLVGVLVALAPVAEGFSFAKVGTLAYPGMGPVGQGGWATIGYSIGLIAFVNYARIEDQRKADVWATVLALLQFLTHMSAGGWKWSTVTASFLIVAASWAINAAWKKR